MALEFPYVPAGYDPAQVAAAAAAYASSRGYVPHMVMQEGEVTFRDGVPGAMIKYIDSQGLTTTEWTPLTQGGRPFPAQAAGTGGRSAGAGRAAFPLPQMPQPGFLGFAPPSASRPQLPLVQPRAVPGPVPPGAVDPYAEQLPGLAPSPPTDIRFEGAPGLRELLSALRQVALRAPSRPQAV